MTTASTSTAAQLEPLPRNVKVLGAVSLAQDTGSEMLYLLLPSFVTGTLGAPVVAVGMADAIASGSAKASAACRVARSSPPTHPRRPAGGPSATTVRSTLVTSLREGLSNVARHARASRVQVDVLVAGEQVLARVTDDGLALPGRTRREGGGWRTWQRGRRGTAAASSSGPARHGAACSSGGSLALVDVSSRVRPAGR